MDNTEQLTISFCSGYGGLERGLELAGVKLRIISYVEIEAYAVANLVNKMETGKMVPAPVWTNLKTFPAEKFRGLVDGIIGGYPCQPFSCAGKRQGENDPRHLWPYIRESIRVIQPRWVFFENVEGHLSCGIVQVLADLEELGYEVKTGIFSAAEVGAPHQRKRVFILGKLGDAADLRLCGLSENAGEITTNKNGEERRMHESSGASPLPGNEPQSKELADTDKPRPQGRHSGKLSECTGQLLAWQGSTQPWPARPGEPQYDWEEPRVVADPKHAKWRAESRRISATGDERRGWAQGNVKECLSAGRQTQSELGRAVNGLTDRIDRLRLLGNGVVPQTAAKAWKTLNPAG